MILFRALLASILSSFFVLFLPIRSRKPRLALTCLVGFALTFSFTGMVAAQTKAAVTETTLAITSDGKGVSSVVAGSIVALTAHVSANRVAVTPGVVNFCDASATSCTDIHLLGRAQLTLAGTAVFKFRPGIGVHSYKAIFLGTHLYASSASGASPLTATGTIPKLVSTTAIQETGSWGAYTLSSSVTETGNTVPPTGTVSFLDSNHGNAVLGTGNLGAATRGVAWTSLNTSAPSIAGVTLAVADLNGDGIQDLFVKDYFGTYDVLLGNGDGTFTVVGSPFGPYSGIGSFTIGDFNNDGIPDVAAITGQIYAPDTTITIFLGNGDGTFTVAGTSPALAYNPTAIATADLNGDGNADLIVSQQESAYSSNSQILIFFGKGDGTFTQASSAASTDGVAGTIIPADLNGDGKVDFVISYGSQTQTSAFLGNGDGTFTAVANTGIPPTGRVYVVDLNNDGIPDLVLPTDVTGNLTVYLGNGDGTFTQAPSSPNVNVRLGIAAFADFNQDGISDIAYTNSDGAGVLLGVGDGSFIQAPLTVTFPYASEGFVVADFNGDGWPDILTQGNDRTVADFLTTPTETATASATVSLTAAGRHLAQASYSGDSNFDGSNSGTTPLWGTPPATVTSIAVTFAGAAVSSVHPGSVLTLTATVTANGSPVPVGQVNFCDGSAALCSDIHVLGSVALSGKGSAAFKFVPGTGTHTYKAVFVENGYGLTSSSASSPLTVGPAPLPVYSDVNTVSVGGVPGDYSLTATVIGYGGSAPPAGTVSFRDKSFGNTVLGTGVLGNSTPGLGWLASQTSFPSQKLNSELVGDFNGDGIPDLALLGCDNIYNEPPFTVTMLFGKGDGTFTTGPSTPLPPSASVVDVIAADFNGDGKEDLVFLTNFLYNSSPTVIPLLGKGDGTFTISTASNVALPPQGGGDVIQPSMVTADFNGDGKPDLGIVGNYIYGGVSILLGNGDGTFTATAANPEFTRGLGMIAVGDFNGDHMPDLVVSDFFSPSSTTVLLGKGDGTFTATDASLSTDTFVRSGVVGDFNGDGKADVAIGFDGVVAVFLGAGDGTFTQPAGSPFTGSGVSLRSGDFNHDGQLDLAAVDTYAQTTVLFLGAGDGTFTTSPTKIGGSLPSGSPGGLVSGDFNEDGVPDLSFVTRFGGTVSILLTEPTETATAALTGVAPVGAGIHNVAASFSGDSNYPSAVSNIVQLTAGLKPVTISPAGGTYSAAQTVTLTEDIPGATIYYEAYGTLNTGGFVQYKGPIALNIGGQETIIAYASETGYQDSSYKTVTFVLNLPIAPTPVISPSGGVSVGAQTVTITDTASPASIYYTTDGTPPSLNSPIYSGPIHISTSGTVAAIAAGGGYSPSPETSAQFFIQSAQTRFIYTVAGNGFWGFSGDGGPAPMAALNHPTNTAIDAAGNFYIADLGNQLVRRVDAVTGIISTVAGSGVAGYSGDGGQALQAQLNYPNSVAVDSHGNLYIGDSRNYVVRRVDAASGTISTVTGTGKMGTGGDDGPATNAMLSFLWCIAIDSADNLYIGDEARVRMVNANTGVIKTVAGSLTHGFSGDGGPATSALMESAMGIAIDRSGNLYIADLYNNTVRKVTTVTGIINTIAGQSGYNNSGYSGDGGPATSAKLFAPSGVAVDAAGNLYIADTGNYVLREVTAADGKINTISGRNNYCVTLSGDGGPADQAGLCYAPGITVDRQGNLYVTEQGYHRIRKITPASAPPSTTTAQPAFSSAENFNTGAQTLTITDATPGAEIYLSINGDQPHPVGQGYFGPISITNSSTIQAMAVAPGHLPSALAATTFTITTPPTAVIQTFAGNGTTALLGIGGPATGEGLGYLTGVASDGAGNIYIADESSFVVWEVSGTTGKISVAAGIPGVYGNPRSPGLATSTALASPQHVVFDKARNLYISDPGAGEALKVDATTGLMTVFAGGGNPQTNLGDGGPATQARIAPFGMAFDQAGDLYIADASNNRIRKVSVASGIITTFAGGGTNGLGDGGPATSAVIEYPRSIAFDSKGNLYIGDNIGRVRVVDAKTGIITTFAGNGNAGATGDGGPATAAEVYANGLAVDASDNLYISNAPGGIRMVPAGGGTIRRVVGVGYQGFEGDGGSATMAELCSPNSLAFDSSGSLYIADSCNHRVRKVSHPSATATPTFSLAARTYSGTQVVTITDATQGAVIYYTTDGSTPTTGSTPYTAPLAVLNSETLQAIAVANGHIASAVTSAAYVINQPTTVPDIGAVMSSLNPSMTGNSVTFTVSVTSSAGSPSGTVRFMDGATQLGSTALTGGSAAYTTSTLTSGSHSITAVYSGDVSFAPATSAALTQVVESFSIGASSGSSSTATTSAGGQATYSLAVTPPVTGGALTFSIAGLPAGATGTFSPSTLAAGTGATNVKLTVSLPAHAALQPLEQPFGQRTWPLVLALVVAPFARRHRKRLRASLSLLMLIAASVIFSFGMTACGGGSSIQTPPAQQTYTLTVTATSGTLTQSTPLKLIVN